ncbi:MAG: hypothetical protein GF350_05880 [Chitinivibrionales bacterium]|nr:hypothetical protein [Chitinivibrionales bacterium]
MHLVNQGGINEYIAEPFRTESLLCAFTRFPSLKKRFITIAALLRTGYLPNPEWRLRIHRGSVTFQHAERKNSAVKLFIDLGNTLSRKADVQVPSNPVVAGVELTNVIAYVRDAIRDRISKEFGEYYLDPRVSRRGTLVPIPNDKFWISPHHEHLYDIVFLPEGFCTGLQVDKATKAELEDRILSALQHFETR